MTRFSPTYLHERDENVRRSRKELALFALWVGLVAAGIILLLVSSCFGAETMQTSNLPGKLTISITTNITEKPLQIGSVYDPRASAEANGDRMTLLAVMKSVYSTNEKVEFHSIIERRTLEVELAAEQWSFTKEREVTNWTVHLKLTPGSWTSVDTNRQYSPEQFFFK